jgi:RNA 3'-terminal phosphate cyclase (ATP)
MGCSGRKPAADAEFGAHFTRLIEGFVIEIDGGFGEGGGQIIRTALSLSVLLNAPFHMTNIRKNRPKPGLRAQHLAAVRAAKEISGGQVEGDEIGSEHFSFTPAKPKGGSYRFEIGTAGATPLVLQTLLPPLVFADVPSRLSLSGGTHVPISPPFHYIEEVFLPVLGELGVRARVSITTYGFYPRGGGQIEAEIVPLGTGRLNPFVSPTEKAVWAVRGTSAVANLPLSIAERQKQAALVALRRVAVGVEIENLSVPSPGAGTFLFLKAQGGACRAGFSSIGIRGKRAEVVGAEAATALLEYYHGEGCVDPHLADQLVIYQALAEGEGSFTTTAITQHLLTNLTVIKRFLDIDYRVEGTAGTPGRVMIRGVGYRRSSG